MAPFCVSASAQYNFEFLDSNNLQTSVGSDNFGCLYSHPGEQWLYITVQDPGDFHMVTSSARDHDFAVWGPFTSLENARSTCGSLQSPIDCSYSGSSTETPSVRGVVAGQVYIVLLTNYARVTQDLSAELGSSNTAGLSCAAVEAVEQQLINEAHGVTADEIECPVCAPAPPRTCADLNADGTTDDPFDCSSEANDLDTVPASVTCAGATCTATECCTAVPPQVCSEQVQLNAAGQAQGHAAGDCECIEPTTEAECLYAAVAACLNAGGNLYDGHSEYSDWCSARHTGNLNSEPALSYQPGNVEPRYLNQYLSV